MSDRLSYVAAAVYWLRGSPEVSANSARVLMDLAEHFNAGTGVAWPRIEVLAVNTGLGVRTVKRALDELRKHPKAPISTRVQGQHKPALYAATDMLGLTKTQYLARVQRCQARHVWPDTSDQACLAGPPEVTTQAARGDTGVTPIKEQPSKEPPKEPPNRKRAPSAPSPDDLAVYEHWVATTKRQRARGLTKDRLAWIQKRRAEEFTTADLCDAIDGNRLDPWYQAKGLDKFEHIFRTAERVEGFIDLKRGQASGTTLAARGRPGPIGLAPSSPGGRQMAANAEFLAAVANREGGAR